MPWKENVKGIITGYLGGEAGGRAIVNCLLGKVNPSGKLAETYPIKIEDTPCYKNYPGTEVSVEYQEAIYVGYRYYDKINKTVLYPFGYGLSYTNFEYSNMNLEKENDDYIVSFDIKNVGEKEGKEIAQIYVSQDDPTIFKSPKELKAFEKVNLKPNEKKTLKIKLDRRVFEYYNVESKKWSVESGNYKVLVGKSSRDIVLKKNIEIKSIDSKITNKYPEVYNIGNIQNVRDEDFESLLGSKIPKRYIELENVTENNTLEQIKNTKVGKAIYDKQMEKMKRLFNEQNVNKATKVMMDLQKPLKKFYEKKNSKYTKKMIEELIYLAKNNEDYGNCDFVKEFLEK